MYISFNILYIVSFINSAVVTGATFPGNASAHTNFKFSSLASFLSIPPGFDAKSIKSTSFFTYCNLSLFKTKCGTVFNIISYCDKFSPKAFIFVSLCPYARIHARSSSFLAAQVTYAANPAIYLANTITILPNPTINTSLPSIIL